MRGLVMESNSSSEPPADVHADGNNQDMISQLPDQILHHILSFLRTRSVVKTMILSKRWRHLWASMPYLFFSHEEFDYGEGKRGEVERFVTAVLLQREKLDVHTFYLHWHQDYDLPHMLHHINIWIQYAVRHNVKILVVDASIDPYEDVDLPSCFYTCETLEKLTLEFHTERGTNINPPKFMRLGRLRELYLCEINLNRDLLQKLISGCPVLEYLDIEECWLEDLDIYCHTLKSLTIKCCQIDGSMIQISIPSLQSFYFLYNWVDGQKVLLENLSSLVDAYIQTDDYHAKALKFISSAVKCIQAKELSDFSRLQNLKRLKLGGWSICDNFEAVAYFLQCAPNLKMLKLTKENEYHRYTKNENKKESLVFGRPHHNLGVHVQCGEENERAIELVTEVFASKCNCPDTKANIRPS